MSWKQEQEIDKIKASERWLQEPRFFGDDTELVVFPGSYSIGVANLGYQFLLGQLMHAGKSFDRFFIDASLPDSISFDTKRPILDFPRWDVTLPFEDNLLQLIKLLQKLDLPLQGSMRQYPIINIGGPMTFINPALISFIANEMYAGEADDDWPEVRETTEWKLAAHFGVNSVVTGPRSVFKNSILIEVARGCMWQCKFCLYRRAYGRIRFVSKERVMETISSAKAKGFDKVGLIAANVSDVPWIGEILQFCEEKNVSVSVSSLAVETLSEKMMHSLKGLGVDQLTVAVEHGDEKTRQQLGKPFTDDELVDTLKAAESNGFRSVKLYFINGITDNWSFNARSAASLLNRLRESVNMKIRVSMSVFVPKPGTPMKDALFPTQKDVEEERKFLVSNCPHVEFTFEPYYEARKEFVLGRLLPEDLSLFSSLLKENGERKAIKFFAEKYA